MSQPSSCPLIAVALLSAWMLGACNQDSGTEKTTPPVVDTDAAKWLAMPRATPVTYAPGSDNVLVQATIDAAGGTLEGPAGSPLEGVTVSFPAGAVTEATTFALGTNDGGNFANLADGIHPEVVMVLNSDGAHVFHHPLTVTYPHADAATIPIPFYLPPEGGITVLRPLPLDLVNGRAGFVTWHASNFTWMNFKPESSDPFITGFDPARDGFAFNNGILDEYAPNGRCVGIANFTKWYRQSQGGGLLGKFGAVVPSKASDKMISGEEVLATRTHTSVMLDAQNPPYLPNREALTAILASVSVGSELVIGISFDSGEESHAILAIGFSDNQIAVYDSNHPTKWKSIDYLFDPNGGEATLSYGEKDALTIFGDLPRAESFPAMTRDAQASFHDESQTKVEITSHTRGETVEEEEITLEGSIHSGQVQVTEATVWVRYEDTSESERQTITLGEDDRDFSVTLPMVGGKNRIMFKTKGYTVTSESLVEIRNDIEKEEHKFELEYDPDGKQGSLVFVQDNMWGTFHFEGDAELFCDGPDSPDGGNGDYLDYTQWTVRGTITNKSTFATNEKGSPCTLTSAAEQPINDGVTFRVWKEDPPTAEFHSLNLQWLYECEDHTDIAALLMYDTKEGNMCTQPAKVPIDDRDTPAGNFTMTCWAAMAPEIGTITGEWDFQP